MATVRTLMLARRCWESLASTLPQLAVLSATLATVSLCMEHRMPRRSVENAWTTAGMRFVDNSLIQSNHQGWPAVTGVSSTLSCDFWPMTVISNVFVKLSQILKKHWNWSWAPVWNGVHHPSLVSLYSTEITRYYSWFLEYKLTGVNSVPHWRPLWILCILIGKEWLFILW